MRQHIHGLLALLGLMLVSSTLACRPGPHASVATSSGAIVITDPSQREAAVGKLVTVTGRQTRSKQPTVAGVDVNGDYALSDVQVRATGRLERYVVGVPSIADDVMMATRSPGTYYALVDPATGYLAKSVRE